MRFICKTINASFDHIIIGQGLAGSCLALQLLRRGKKVIVFDQPQNNRASAVAAGLFNPVTGKRLTKAWEADKVFPYLFQFYAEAEESLGQKFFYPQPIYQPFVSIAEQNDWMARSESRELKKFVERIFTESVYGDQTYDDFGGILINHTGYLNTNLFMQGLRLVLEKENAYQPHYFDISLLKIRNDKVNYKNYEGTNIIFCEGLGSLKNPLFGWVPIIPLKGETLSISIKEKPKAIFNRGVYLVPSGREREEEYLAGATYQPNDHTEGISTTAKAELEEKISALIKIPFKTNFQNWGIRPSTRDRRPVLGAHPLYKNVIAFNGLGTKGVSLAPYFSDLLADWLCHEAEIPSEINIARFKALYS